MKILFIAPEITELVQISDFGGVWSYYLTREFRARGIDVQFSRGSKNPEFYATLDLDGVDHVIAVSRLFTQAPAECAWILAERITGAVAQVRDRVRSHDPVNVTFTVLDDKRGATGINVYAGWAADKELCSPRQTEALTVLIDHPNYGVGNRVDLSEEIAEDVAAFAQSQAWLPAYPSIRVRRIEDGAVRGVRILTPKPPVFTRQHIPYEKVCAEYCKAHIFLVTHPESIGLSVLETALAGALVVAPRGFIAPELLATVRHVEYDARIPWPRVLKSINPAKSRKVALANSWQRVATRILEYLEQVR